MDEALHGVPVIGRHDPGGDEPPVWPLHDMMVMHRWIDAGFTYESAQRWYRVWGDGHQPMELATWQRAQFGPASSRAWARAGFDVDQALAWSSQGCSAKDALLYGGIEVLRRWKSFGFSVRQAKKWRRLFAVDDPELAATWRDLGCSPGSARAWLNVPGVRGPSDVGIWLGRGCSPERATRWMALAVTSGVQPIEDFLALGMSLSEAEAWSALFPGDLAAASAWLAVGCGPTATAIWRSLSCIEVPGDVAPWHQAGVNASFVERWDRAFAARAVDRRSLTPSAIAASIHAGCTPKQAARCAAADREPVDVMRLAEHGLTPRDAAQVSDYHRPTPLKGTNEPRDHRGDDRTSVGCRDGEHGRCDEPRWCRCACHCWHDEAQFDHERHAMTSRANRPKLVFGSGRTRHCRSTEPARHRDCRSGGHCGCSCHCWHVDLAPLLLAAGRIVDEPKKKKERRSLARP